jgi:hypothetical protein
MLLYNKLKLSCHNDIIDVINQLVYYGRPPTMMHAVLVAIFDSG